MKILKEFVQQYNPKGFEWDEEKGDSKEVPLNLYTLFYNIFRRFKAWQPIYILRMKLQRIFRLNRLADCDIWEAQGTMAKRILPVLYAFKKYERAGFPSIYSEYEENAWGSVEKYNEAIKNGTMIGGGEEAWKKEIDHIIHAIEYIAWEGNNKKIHKWYIDNFGADPYDNNEVNKYKYYTYKTKEGNTGMTFRERPEESEDITNIKEHISYGNRELLDKIDSYVSEGLKKLGISWRAFWD